MLFKYLQKYFFFEIILFFVILQTLIDFKMKLFTKNINITALNRAIRAVYYGSIEKQV